MNLLIIPVTLREAHSFVEQHHRHNSPSPGGIFAIACAEGHKIVGVVVVGRPIARALQDGFTAEVNRLVTDGTKNACSMLYAAAWRAARAMGYHRLVTYILDSEPGTSLRAAGWKVAAESTRARSWNFKCRPRVDTHPLQHKMRWEMTA